MRCILACVASPRDASLRATAFRIAALYMLVDAPHHLQPFVCAAVLDAALGRNFNCLICAAATLLMLPDTRFRLHVHAAGAVGKMPWYAITFSEILVSTTTTQRPSMLYFACVELVRAFPMPLWKRCIFDSVFDRTGARLLQSAPYMDFRIWFSCSHSNLPDVLSALALLLFSEIMQPRGWRHVRTSDEFVCAARPHSCIVAKICGQKFKLPRTPTLLLPYIVRRAFPHLNLPLLSPFQQGSAFSSPRSVA